MNQYRGPGHKAIIDGRVSEISSVNDWEVGYEYLHREWHAEGRALVQTDRVYWHSNQPMGGCLGGEGEGSMEQTTSSDGDKLKVQETYWTQGYSAKRKSIPWKGNDVILLLHHDNVVIISGIKTLTFLFLASSHGTELDLVAGLVL